MSESRFSFARSVQTMAVGTTLSRVTGLVRVVALISFVGTGGLADSYNLANTVPNMLVDLVLAGVLSATFVPVFVQRLTVDDNDDALDAVSAISSATLLAIAAASALFLVAVPLIVHLLTIGASQSALQAAQTATERTTARELLYLFVPQLACYGLISLVTALLNSAKSFAAPMFAPIANNLVVVAVLVELRLLVGGKPTLQSVADHRSWILLLGLGTTAGVVLQAALLVPSLLRSGLRLRWLLDLRHPAVATVVRLSGWTFGLVVGNQLALWVVLTMSVATHVPGAVSAYTYAYQFFQLPYGIVAVSVMSAATPLLAERWSLDDLDGFKVRFATGLRSLLGVVVPAAMAMLVLAHPLTEVLGRGTSETGQSLSMLALGIPGFCTFLFVIRAFQSTQDLKGAFWLYAIENSVNIVLAVALAPSLGVKGVALSITVAYTIGALAALAALDRKIGGLRSDILVAPFRRVLLCSFALAIGAALGVNVTASTSELALIVRLLLGAAGGGVAFLGLAVLLERNFAKRR